MINAAILLVMVAAGSWIALRGQPRTPSVALALAAGPAIGFGCLYLVSFFVLFFGARLSFSFVALGLICVLAILALAQRSAAGASKIGVPEADSWPLPRSIVFGAVAVTLAAIAIAALHWIQWAPYGTTDAVGFWTSRGLFLNRVDGDIALRFSLMTKAHPTYPLLLPSALAGQYTLAGNESLVTPQLFGMTFLAALLVLVWAVTCRFGGDLRAWLALLLVGSAPILWRWAYVQCADVPLAYLFLLSAAGLYGLVACKNSPLFSPFLTGFFVGMLFSIKTEGHAAALLLVAIAAGFAALNGRFVPTVRNYAPLLAGGMAPGFIATILFKRVWCRDVSVPEFIRTDFVSAFSDLGRWKFTIARVIDAYTRVDSMELWGLFWVFVAAVGLVSISSLLRGARPQPNLQMFLFFACTGMIFAYGSAYVLTPYDLGWQIDKSIDRLLMQVMPSITIAAILAIGPKGKSARSSTGTD